MQYTRTITNAHTSLSYRLGESAIPVDATELARRLEWFSEALRTVLGSGRDYWFMQIRSTMPTVANQPRYSSPTNCRKIIELRIDNYRYSEISYEDKYEKYENPMATVPILPIYMDRAFYILADEFYPIPIPSSAPTPITLTSLTSSGTTCTATYTAEHGYSTDDYVVIAGASPTDYNGTFRIIVTGVTTFTYTALVAPASSPATGTITAAKNNIDLVYFKNLTVPIDVNSVIDLPDDYMDIIVSYAEGRYWSYAHKRAKAADSFTEFEKRVNDLDIENFKRKFYAP